MSAPSLSRSELEALGWQPWVWGTVTRHKRLHNAYLRHNGDILYDPSPTNRLGRDLWHRFTPVSGHIRPTWTPERKR